MLKIHGRPSQNKVVYKPLNHILQQVAVAQRRNDNIFSHSDHRINVQSTAILNGFLNYVLDQSPYSLCFVNWIKNNAVTFLDKRPCGGQPAEMCILPEIKCSKVLNIHTSVGTREELTDSLLSLVGILWLRHQFYFSLQTINNQIINQLIASMQTGDNHENIIPWNSITWCTIESWENIGSKDILYFKHHKSRTIWNGFK